MTTFRNPVSYSIYLACGALVLLSFGESVLLVVQHLFLPYTVDITRGVGEDGAMLFRAVTLVLQLLIAGSIALLVRAEAAGSRVTFSVAGILLVVAYFSVVAIGYIAPRLH